VLSLLVFIGTTNTTTHRWWPGPTTFPQAGGIISTKNNKTTSKQATTNNKSRWVNVWGVWGLLPWPSPSNLRRTGAACTRRVMERNEICVWSVWSLCDNVFEVVRKLRIFWDTLDHIIGPSTQGNERKDMVGGQPRLRLCPWAGRIVTWLPWCAVVRTWMQSLN